MVPVCGSLISFSDFPAIMEDWKWQMPCSVIKEIHLPPDPDVTTGMKENIRAKPHDMISFLPGLWTASLPL